jgi:hypothetical protein
MTKPAKLAKVLAPVSVCWRSWESKRKETDLHMLRGIRASARGGCDEFTSVDSLTEFEVCMNHTNDIRDKGASRSLGKEQAGP